MTHLEALAWALDKVFEACKPEGKEDNDETQDFETA